MDPQKIVSPEGEILIPDPPVARFFFSSTKWPVWLWLALRLYLGAQWLSSGTGKLSNPAWMSTGEALKGFWTSAVQVPASGKPPIVFDWYRNFLQYMLDAGWYTWFSKLIVFGEIAIGLGLILGMFVGIAAFAGGFMNWNFIMAGSASTNGWMFGLEVLLILAWKNAGWLGLDRWLLPLLGTPWTRSPGVAATPPPRGVAAK